MEKEIKKTVEMNEKVELDGIKIDGKVEIDGEEDITGRWTETWRGR